MQRLVQGWFGGFFVLVLAGCGGSLVGGEIAIDPGTSSGAAGTGGSGGTTGQNVFETRSGASTQSPASSTGTSSPSTGTSSPSTTSSTPSPTTPTRPSQLPSASWRFADVSSTIAGAVEAAGDRPFDIDVQDYDGDGDIEMLVVDHSGVVADASKLFRNDAGTFVDVTTAAFGTIQGEGNIQDALSADLDGDGFLDLVTTSNDGIGWAYKGTGPLRFDRYPSFPGGNGRIVGRGVTFGDIDNDGDLDVFISHHGGPPHLYRNDGSAWADVTATLPTNLFSSIQPYFADFNGDGNVDLLTTVQLVYFSAAWPSGVEARAHLLLGNGNGTFRDATGPSGIGALGYVNCPIAVGDLDNDGDLDIAQIGVPHDPASHAFLGGSALPRLLANDGTGVFTDRTAGSGVPASYSGNAEYWEKGVIEDLDNDGMQDIVLVRVGPQLLRNRGNFTFESQESTSFDFTGYGPVAAADFDEDGDMDLAFTRQDPYSVRLFGNQQNDANWLKVRLSGGAPNRSGIGARIAVSQAGTLRGYREVIASSNHHTPYVQHFGLPAGSYDIEVRWPGGAVTRRSGVATGQTVTVSR